MNAYELADLIEEDMEEGFGLGFLQDAIQMMRKQADRIAELEELNETFVDLIKSYRVEIKTLRQEILNKENEK